MSKNVKVCCFSTLYAPNINIIENINIFILEIECLISISQGVSG